MHELTTTRHNPMIDPSLHVWGWEIPVYLFLGGMVAGIMIISGYFLFSGRHRASTQCSCFQLPLVGLVLLTLGMLALFLDLEHKLFTWRLYTTFEIKSPMSWGAWILILVYPALAAVAALRVPELWRIAFKGRLAGLVLFSERIRGSAAATKTIGIVNMLLGGLLGIYTGVLLSALGARPLWSSSILWLLFVVSGLSSAAAFAHMIARDPYERVLLAKADNGFLIFELFVFALFFIGLASTSDAHLRAAQLLLGGAFAPAFWVLVIGLGIVIPLIVQLMAVNGKIPHTPVAPILVMGGGLALRFVIVSAGQFSHWMNAHGLPLPF